MCNHSSVLVFLTAGQRHLESVGDQGLTHVTRQLSDDNPLGVNVEDDSEVAPPFPVADVGKAGGPQLVGTIIAEVAILSHARR